MCAIASLSWSARNNTLPDQASGWLKREEGSIVSKLTIYNWASLRIPRINVRKCLRYGEKQKRKAFKEVKVYILCRIFIEQRPEDANGQTMGGEHHCMKGQESKPYHFYSPLSTCPKNTPLPTSSILTDNGLGFAAHEIIARELWTICLFCPYLLFS